jgi:hypothetical protein
MVFHDGVRQEGKSEGVPPPRPLTAANDAPP